MGCSPSKGKLISEPHHFGIQRALVTEVSQEGVNCGPALDEDTHLKPQEKEEEPSLLTYRKETSLTRLESDPTLPENVMDIKVTNGHVMPQEIIGDAIQNRVSQVAETRKKNIKRSTERERKSFAFQTKVDFPPHMVRAHQAAYSFLNSNISKYETLLRLLDQAVQTQLSLQSIISTLDLFFEEINQALEEMAEEGELMLKEHGDSITLPSGMLGSAKPRTTTVDHFDPSPDLLHQLLQYSSEKLRQVKNSVKTLSNNTLEEAIEYFSSLSKMFAERLQTKHAAELRLAQVLARVEISAIGKSNPKDSALHSEDSGIGGENESSSGPEKHPCHCGRAESGSFRSEVKTLDMLQNHSNNLASSLSYIKDYEEKNKKEEDADKYEGYENDQCTRKRSSSSPPDPCHVLGYMHSDSIKDRESKFNRLYTATDAEHCSSSSCINVMTEVQKSQKDVDKLMISEMKELHFVRPQYILQQDGLRRHSLNGSVGMHKSQVSTNQPPDSSSSPPNKPLKHHSVRKLVDTFSQGVNGRPGQSISQIPPCTTKPSKSYNLQVNNTEEDKVSNNRRSSQDGRIDLDIDVLPPPPLEILMDNSFQHEEGQLQNEKLLADPVPNLSLIDQSTGSFRRRKVTMQNVEILPNKANVKPRLVPSSNTPPFRQERVPEVQHKRLQLDTEMSEKSERTTIFHKQTRKITHFRKGESTDKKKILVQISGDIKSYQATSSHRGENNEVLVSEMFSCNLPIIAPPVSRVRLPPSCPSVRHSFPSPPIFRMQSNSGSVSHSNYPQTVAQANDNSEEIIPYVSFHDARSVFCQNELQSSQACLSFGSPVLPRRWGEVIRNSSSSRGGDNPSRRSQSEQRHQMTSYSEMETNGHLLSQETKDKPVREL